MLVWRSLTEGEGLFAGMRAAETGWSVITPLDGNSGAMATTFMRPEPKHFGDTAENQLPAKQFTNMIHDTGIHDMDEMTQQLQSLLLQDV